MEALSLVLALLLAAATAEPQVLVLSSDKMPVITPLQPVAPVNAKPPTLPNLQALRSLQSLQAQALHNLRGVQNLQNLQALQNLQGAVERAKRSGNLLQLLGGASGASGSSSAGGGAAAAPGGGILASILSSSSGNSAGGAGVVGKGPSYGNYIGTGAGLPMVYGQRSFDLQSFKRSLMGVLMQAVRAITGGVIALKGQLVRVKGQLISAKGNIISASGEALSQFGRNIASNALSPKPPEPPAPPPRPVYGPPGYVSMVPRPVYGPPMYAPHGPLGPVAAMGPMASLGLAGQLPIPRPLYGAPPPPAFSTYSNAISHDLPRYQGFQGFQGYQAYPPAAAPPPPPAPAAPPKVQIQPSIEAFSSHSISGSLDSYGPPASGSPFDSASFPSSNTYSSASSASQSSVPAPPQPPAAGQSTPTNSYGPPQQQQPSAGFNSNSINLAEQSASFGAPGPAPAGQQAEADSYFKRNVNQDLPSASPSRNALEGAHAGLLLLKPASNVGSALNKDESPKGSLLDGQNQQPQTPFFDLSQVLGTGPGYASQQEFGARLGEGGDTSSSNNKNERTFSLLFGSKKPTPLRPHPVTKALPPQVVAAASAKLAAQLDFAGRAPPRTAVAVSGPQGQFIMYQ